MAEGQGGVWTQDETRFLIILWADQTIQSRLGTSRNREGIQMLVDGLAAEGYLCTPKQVRAKFKALKHKYRKANEANRRSGSGRSLLEEELLSQGSNLHMPRLCVVDLLTNNFVRHQAYYANGEGLCTKSYVTGSKTEMPREGMQRVLREWVKVGTKGIKEESRKSALPINVQFFLPPSYNIVSSVISPVDAIIALLGLQITCTWSAIFSCQVQTGVTISQQPPNYTDIVSYTLVIDDTNTKSREEGENRRREAEVEGNGARSNWPGSFGPGNFMATMKMGKTKFRTELKRADSLVWNESAEFTSWSTKSDGQQDVVLKIRKAKKCTERTVGTVTINVKEALETNLHLPVRRRYLVTPSDKQHKCRVFLEVSVTVDEGSKGETADKPASLDESTKPKSAQAVAPLTEIDPRCREQISAISTIYAELIAKQFSSAELLAYVNGIRDKLSVAAPHVLDNVVIKNIAANVPDATQYNLPELAGQSLEGLGKVLGVVQRLNQEEEARLHFIRKWYVDEVCRQAMEAAPEVLEGG
ncbi:hypothetical protein Bbelb_069400 [Branchiostoma belcheri]|nr:hypothetical protein Bbelb_069400 [Branchiostoma belcheri]